MVSLNSAGCNRVHGWDPEAAIASLKRSAHEKVYYVPPYAATRSEFANGIASDRLGFALRSAIAATRPRDELKRTSAIAADVKVARKDDPVTMLMRISVFTITRKESSNTKVDLGNWRAEAEKHIKKASSLQQAIASAQSFSTLRLLAERAETSISFWGNRYLSVKGCSGFVHIDAIAARAAELLKQNPHFCERERPHGKSLAGRIVKIYDESDELFDKSNFLTKVIVILRNLPNIFSLRPPFGHTEARWQWKESVRMLYEPLGDVFDFYTKPQLLKVFGRVPDTKGIEQWGEKRWRVEVIA